MAFATPFMKLGLPGSVTRQYYDYYKDINNLNNYVTTVYKLLNISAIIIGIILLFLAYFFKSKICNIKFLLCNISNTSTPTEASLSFNSGSPLRYITDTFIPTFNCSFTKMYN